MSSTSTLASSSIPRTPQPGVSPQRLWIYGPWVDLIVGCGAWSGPLLLLAFAFARVDSSVWTLAFYFLALLFNYPHFMATVYRAYHTHTEFARYRIFTVHVTMLLAVAGVLTHLWYALLPWLFTLYICWSPWHYTGQNFGLLMMFSRRAGIAPSTAERRALRFAFVASFLMLMLSFHTGSSGDALILSLGWSARFTTPARLLLCGFFLLATSWALARMAFRSGVRAIVAPLVLVLTQFFWFLLPVVIELVSGREVPQTRYSSGLLAVLHSTQYLWITSYYQAREARAAGNTDWKFSRYLVTLMAGGIALFIPGPWIVSSIFHADFAASFLTFTALVNIHHFLLDGAIWKLRDSRVASLLLGAREKGPALASPVTWVAGPAKLARALRIGVAAVLFLWAAMDQAHFYLASRADDLSSLRRAARWNPNDSAVELHLASAEQASGMTNAALQSLRRASEINPQSVSLHEAYARGLLLAGRRSEADEQFQKILALQPRNPDAWVNLGLLAQSAGRAEEARDSWQRAVDIDPGQAHAQLYLAQSLEAHGELQAAARHYRAFLEIFAAHPAGHPEDRDAALAARIKIADANAATERNAEAAREYEETLGYAENAGNKSLQALALAHLADVQEKSGNFAAAALSYRRALALDAGLDDRGAAAVDWFNYAQYLLRRSQPERLAFACFLRAETLLPERDGDARTQILHARAQSESRLGKSAAAAVRGNRKAALDEALSLPTASFSASR